MDQNLVYIFFSQNDFHKFFSFSLIFSSINLDLINQTTFGQVSNLVPSDENTLDLSKNSRVDGGGSPEARNNFVRFDPKELIPVDEPVVENTFVQPNEFVQPPIVTLNRYAVV